MIKAELKLFFLSHINLVFIHLIPKNFYLLFQLLANILDVVFF